MTTLTGTCHCGDVRVTLPRAPETLTECNCSICRRTGAVLAYYPVDEVQVEAAGDATHEYVWGDRCIRFVRCARCGVFTHWLPTDPAQRERMGVNTRLFEPGTLGSPRLRHFDGAVTWAFLD